MSAPDYYLQASEIARPALLELGITHYDGECRLVMEEHYPWFLHSFYLGNAVKYLWRCGGKGDLIGDLEKCEDYLRWYLPDAQRFGTGDAVSRCLAKVQDIKKPKIVRLCDHPHIPNDGTLVAVEETERPEELEPLDESLFDITVGQDNHRTPEETQDLLKNTDLGKALGVSHLL